MAWFRQGSLQRISSYACPASYGNAMSHNLYRAPGIIMRSP
ncbi:MAG: hypothetical protein ACMUEL_04795 [Flavobacteriales bacterium Tduv]